ncbi:hypothetical protein [Bifidobacterium olomucense]|uniref:Uncharacterized protein n=1 Tax=Bifidobacterium olomucense TaxID=2675324 RepID=A0A7Y0HW94_9BIFI|nr:hypothetical protein [Bifidobacterium sp. DSM 109959]NMM98101.1 hypothetical protein [Bifidobacterium sp. DSM 109959]
MSQAKKGPLLPLARQGEAIFTNIWLKERLGRPLYAAEAQTFGRMCLDEWRYRFGNRMPYTMRVGEDSSQRTVYLPEDIPLLVKAFDRYVKSKSYRRVQAELEEHHDQ